MSDNIQTNTTGRLKPCLQQKIDKTRYLVKGHFSATSTQSVEDKLKRVILHDLEHRKQGRPRKSDENDSSLFSTSRAAFRTVFAFASVRYIHCILL